MNARSQARQGATRNDGGLRRLAPVAAAVLAGVGALGGCTVGGQRSVSAENDRLRREIIALQDQVATLRGEQAELRIKLGEATRAGVLLQDAEALAALPVCVGVGIDSGSGPAPFDAQPGRVVVSFVPVDGRGRFVQVAGTARAEVLALPAGVEPGASGEPRRVGVVTLSPAQVRDAYRDGFGGARYEVDVLADPEAVRGRTLVLRVELADALTKRVHVGERIVRVRE